MSVMEPINRQTALDKIREDEALRRSVESLSHREDRLGAVARVALARADGKLPKKQDCEDAGLPTLYRILAEEQ